jgi:hypothetical protein
VLREKYSILEEDVKKLFLVVAVIAAVMVMNGFSMSNQVQSHQDSQSQRLVKMTKSISVEAVDFRNEQFRRLVMRDLVNPLDSSSEGELISSWAKKFVGSEDDEGTRILQTRDGGFIITGTTWSFTSWLGILVLKLSSLGEIEWEKVYKANPDHINRGYDIKETVEGGYVLVGYNVQKVGIYNTRVLLIISLTSSGDVNWAQKYDYSTTAEHSHSIQQTSDKGFIVSGQQWHGHGPLGSDEDVWILKLSSTGDVEWQRSYSAAGYQPPYGTGTNIIETVDGQGYVFTVTTDSFYEDWTDIWLVKIDLTGEIIWQKAFGGPETEAFGDYSGPFMQQAKDGKIYLVASTFSFGANYQDVWVLKLQPNGNIIWQKRYDGGYADRGVALELKDNGECVVFGITKPSQNDDVDFLVLELLPDGNLKKTPKSYGIEDLDDILTCGIIANNQGYVLLGNNSNNNQYDLLVIKTSPTGTVSPSQDIENQVPMTVADTYCVPYDTAAFSYISPDFPKRKATIFESTSNFSTELVSWNLHQPPTQVTIDISINRGIFYGEAINTISWQPDPYNSQFSIDQYNIYRKEAEFEGEIFFKLHASVPAGQLFYADEQLDSNKKYTYYVTTVDSDGKESPKSKIVENN